MKNTTLALLLIINAASATAQVPSLCERPAYASEFRSRYPKELAIRQSLGRVSDEEGAARLAQLREETLGSKLVAAGELSTFLADASAQPDIVELRKEQEKAVKSYDSYQISMDVIPIAVGNDPAKQARAFCIFGRESFVALAKKRKASERLGALMQQRLVTFGNSKGVAYTDKLLASLQPLAKACNSEAGAAIAQEEAELALDTVRADQKRTESELDAKVKARSEQMGWDKQKVSEIFARISKLPTFIALEEQKRPLAAEVQSWSQAERQKSEHTESTEPCTWPGKLISFLQQIAVINQRQYALMAEELQKAE